MLPGVSRVLMDVGRKTDAARRKYNCDVVPRSVVVGVYLVLQQRCRGGTHAPMQRAEPTVRFTSHSPHSFWVV
jgi:hypothetical protein